MIGVGLRGTEYARALASGAVPGAMLAAVSDERDEALEPYASVPRFPSAVALVRSGVVDAVIVATPHRQHVQPTLVALAAGLHVLTEKPLATDLLEVRRMLDAHARRPRAHQAFATALVLRRDPRYQALRDLLRRGALGRVQRVSWTVTDCLRSEAYYQSAPWRGSFEGEGGGLLVNQCSHQLDLWQWLFGMPERVRAFLGLGRFHAIEVEDQITAHLEHDSGMTGVFVASTGEFPGTNRLEVAGELGKIVVEGDAVEIWRNSVSTREHVKSAGARTPAPAAAYERLALARGGVTPAGLLANFVAAVTRGERLVAPAAEGLASVELASALLSSGLSSRTVELPGSAKWHPRIQQAAAEAAESR